MARHALVIGAPGGPLQGVEHDAQRMIEALGQRGFVVTECCGPAATRAGILAAYAGLTARIAVGDAVVVYYAGHGSYAALAGHPASSWQCIVPVDYAAGGEADWRGISGLELSILHARLTAVTRNATAIFDCCHATHMSRGEDGEIEIPRALPHPLEGDFAAHLAALRALYGDEYDAPRARANPDLVRVFACGRHEIAAERIVAGVPGGVFTRALLQVLGAADEADLSWYAVIELVRALARRETASQRPEVEGPGARRVFTLLEEDGSGRVAIERGWIAVGALHGVAVGDTYDVFDVGAPEARLACATVREVAALRAAVVLEPDIALSASAIARPATRARTWPVAIEPAALAQVLPATLRQARAGEAPLAWVAPVGDGSQLEIRDARGVLWPAGDVATTTARLVERATGAALVALVGAHGVARDELEIELGAVIAGGLRVVPPETAFGCGDAVAARIENRGKRALFVHVFGVGLRGTVAALDVTNERLYPGEVLVAGRRADGVLEGFGIAWPRGMPHDGAPRRDRLVVIATTQPTSLADFAKSGAQARGSERAAEGFAVIELPYQLFPVAAALVAPAFEVDRDPTATGGGVGDTRATAALTVRLAAVELEAPAMRLELLACTRGGWAAGAAAVALAVEDFVAITVWLVPAAAPPLVQVLAGLAIDVAREAAVGGAAAVAAAVGARVPGVVGVYRVAFTAAEQFGCGCHRVAVAGVVSLQLELGMGPGAEDR